MSVTPEEIRDRSMARFNEVAGKKFDDGVKEHKTLLTDVDNLDELENEIIDMWHYVQALKMNQDER